jgi:hypothetical protein
LGRYIFYWAVLVQLMSDENLGDDFFNYHSRFSIAKKYVVIKIIITIIVRHTHKLSNAKIASLSALKTP